MGFWDSFGEAVGKAVRASGEAAGRSIQNTNDNFYKASERSVNYSDEKLIREFKNSHDIGTKMGYAKELQNRGYGKKD